MRPLLLLPSGMFNLCDHLRHLGITTGYAGGFAEKMVLNGEVLTHGIIHHIPDGLDYAVAALAEPLSSVWPRTTRRTRRSMIRSS